MYAFYKNKRNVITHHSVNSVKMYAVGVKI